MFYVICFQGNFDLRWPEPIYLRVGYVFESGFRQEWFNRFLWFLASLILCTNSWSNLSFKWNTNTFVKADTQIGENSRWTVLSARVFLPKASVATNWVIRNLRRIQFVIQEARLNNFYLSKLLCIFPSLFAKNLNKARYNIYGNLLPFFSTEGSRLVQN